MPMPAELAPGTVVAGYRVEALLGHGAMADVYRARDERLDRVVALKVLDRLSAADERFRRRFLRESEIAASLDHQNVVRVLAAGDDDGRLYLAMELIDGQDLRRLLREHGPLEPERAVALVEQVAAGLDVAHQAGLVHRDVKPGNILVAAERAFICDFGIARHVSSVSSLTVDRGFIGSIDYVPPEQIEGGPIDGRADQYSLACVLYECLAGSRPFERDSELSVVFAHLNEPPPRLTDVRPDLPAAFDQVFATALAKDPAGRYSTCSELAAAARAALSGRVLTRRKPRRRLYVVATAGVLAAAAAATAVALLTGGHASRVTITPTSIGGAYLGDSNLLVRTLWGGGQKLLTDTPGTYVEVRQRKRNLAAYFIGTTDRAVELTTWNRADRTAEGIGPCSTLADLRRVYGKRLKPNPHNTDPHTGTVYGWTVGKHLDFSMGPNTNPVQVQTVAIHSNDLASAGYIASNDGPCAPATLNSPITRPTRIPETLEPALPLKLVSRAFRPRLTVRVPRGWRATSDTPRDYRIVAPGGTSIDFRFDPIASTPDGSPIRTVSTTATSLAAWLQRNTSLAVTAPQYLYLGRQVFRTLYLGVDRSQRARPGAVRFLTFDGVGHPPPIATATGRYARVYLTPVRIKSLTHTFAIVADAPSRRAFQRALPVIAAIVKNTTVAAAPAGILSAFSSLCTIPYRGTCRGEIAPGTYSTRTFKPGLTYTVPSLGWTNSADNNGQVGLIPPGGDYSSVDFGGSDYIDVFTSIATGNGRCGDGPGTVHTPEGFVRWLKQQPGFAPFTPIPVTVGGLSGVGVDLRFRRGFTKKCPWSGPLPGQNVLTGLPPSPDNLNHSLPPGHAVMRLYLLHYKQGTLGIEIDDVRDDSRLAVYKKVVESFRFHVH
jgi:tRNA A-37 threonylcarbamoyl transferase component Bud32